MPLKSTRHSFSYKTAHFARSAFQALTGSGKVDAEYAHFIRPFANHGAACCKHDMPRKLTKLSARLLPQTIAVLSTN
jgi:hypothetical protein